MSMHYRCACLAAFFSLLLLSGSAAAQQVTVYDNFGPGQGGFDYNWGLGWTVAGENVSSQYGVEQAMLFSPTESGVVTDVWIAAWYVPLDPQADEITLRLVKGDPNTPPQPEDVMEEWTITSFQSWSAWSPPHHLTGSGTSYVEKGKSYWLWAIGGLTTWCGWCMNENPSLTCPHAMRREGENWLPVSNETASAFRVDVALDFGLAADDYELSAATGGTVAFHLGAGAAQGNRNYLLLGSLSGTSPGTPLPGGGVLPLNLDTFSNTCFLYRNTTMFQDFAGTLDGAGVGAALFDTLKPRPGAVGLTLSFAYALTGSWDFGSNAVEIRVLP